MVKPSLDFLPCKMRKTHHTATDVSTVLICRLAKSVVGERVGSTSRVPFYGVSCAFDRLCMPVRVCSYVVNGQTLEEERSETRSGSSTDGVEHQESLQTRAVISELADAVQRKVDDLLAYKHKENEIHKHGEKNRQGRGRAGGRNTSQRACSGRAHRSGAQINVPMV